LPASDVRFTYQLPREGADAVSKTYSTADVKAAIDLAEGHRYSSFTMVWGGNDSHFQPQVITNKKTGEVIKTIYKYQPPPDEAEKVSGDEAHTLRNHVKGHQAPEYEGKKSRYDDLQTCLEATREALNSSKVQEELGKMDADQSITERKISTGVAGNYYGDGGDDVKKKIEWVTIIVMRLGTDTLWIHTSYPTSFVA
jgi:hypothetical protein